MSWPGRKFLFAGFVLFLENVFLFLSVLMCPHGEDR